jgi:uncharacterized repeat protein (TIGR03803 family)
MKKLAMAILLGLFLLVLPAHAGIDLLHEFNYGTGDGAHPLGSLLRVGPTLYGMTNLGGISNFGTIFKIQTDGSGFTVLHEFLGGGNDGKCAWGNLVILGSTLYGVTQRGGDFDKGTIFKIQTNGTGFSLLHEFGAGTDGASPEKSLLLNVSTLYGVTSAGGAADKGTVFKIRTSGTYTVLHEFSGTDGDEPTGGVVLSGSTLFGMTSRGGGESKGTIYKIQTNGDGFDLLREFAGGNNDGDYPMGRLVFYASTLYGVTGDGGDDNGGTIFSIQTDGTDFTLLHKFAGGVDDGESPHDALTLSGSVLYGMTQYGGIYDYGTVFKVQTNGSGFSLLHKFTGADNGKNPSGSLIISGSFLYGQAFQGGDHDCGVIFILPVPKTDFVDFNSDGKTDIVWWNAATGRNIAWYMNNVTRLDSVYLPTQDTAWTLAGCADFNADGKTDIMWWNPATGRNICWYMDGVTRLDSVYLPTQDTAWTNVGAGDINNDGKPDMLWRNLATGRNIVWYMDGVTRTDSVYLPTQDTAWTLAGCADFKADRRTDIMWWNAATGGGVVWYMNGAAKTGEANLPTQDTAWENVGSGDFNRDGDPDILWRNKTTGRNIVWYMNWASRAGSVYLPTQSDLDWKLAN